MTPEQRAVGVEFLDAVAELPVIDCWHETTNLNVQCRPARYAHERTAVHAMVVVGGGTSKERRNHLFNELTETQVKQAWDAADRFFAFKGKKIQALLFPVFEVLQKQTGFRLRCVTGHLDDELPPGLQHDTFLLNTGETVREGRERLLAKELLAVASWSSQIEKHGWKTAAQKDDLSGVQVYLLVSEMGQFLGDGGALTTLSSARLFASQAAAERTMTSRGWKCGSILSFTIDYGQLVLSKGKVPDIVARAESLREQEAIQSAIGDATAEGGSPGRKARI